MFCPKCGNQIDPSSRFCPSCGTNTAAGTAPPPPGVYPQQTRLYRPRTPRVIAGVCSGLALHYGWDISLVRLIWVLCILFGGTGLFAYIICWVVIPEAPYQLQ
jgi:phage shock protein C